MSIHYLPQKQAAHLPIRHLSMPDPVNPLQTCEVCISPAGIKLTRKSNGVNMVIGLQMKQYRGLAARDNDENGYSLRLLSDNASWIIPLGFYTDIDALARDWVDWGCFTGLPLLIESENGSVRPVNTAPLTERRKGQASSLKDRRGYFAGRRRPGDNSRMAQSFQGARVIASYE